MEEAAIHHPKTHDLEVLLKLVLPVEPLWSALRPALRSLSGFAVEFRYPGVSATAADAKQALLEAKCVRQEVRQSFGI